MPRTPRDNLVFCSRYIDEPAARAALADLLREVFDLDLTPLERLGGWDPSSVPFSYVDAAGECIANVSTVAMPMILQGHRVDAVGIQSVAVRPSWRGNGLCRDLMEKALAWCDARTPLVLLRTVIPALYTRFGFRPIPEHSFVGSAPEPRKIGRALPLSRSSAADMKLLLRLLAVRTPVSQQVGLLGLAPTFMLNACHMPGIALHYLSARNAIVATETGNPEGLRLLDVVGSSIPSLADILGALELQPSHVEVCFPPDQLGWDGLARPVTEGTILMARGRLALGNTPFMLPPTAAF